MPGRVDKIKDRSRDVVAGLPEDTKKIVSRFLLTLCIIVFAIEMAVMMVLPHVIKPATALASALLDAVLVAVIAYPLLYLLCINPLVQKYSERRRSDRRKGADAGAKETAVPGFIRGLTGALQGFQTRLTGRIWSAEQLRETEERYRILFEQSLDGILIVDPETMLPVVFNNTACAQLGYSREEFARLKVADHDASESPGLMMRHVEEAVKGQNSVFETIQRCKEGETRDVQVIIQPIEEAGRTVLSVIFRDITETRRTEEHRRQAEIELIKARDELELRVAERTGELARINERLRTEVAERKQAEDRLKLLLKVFESAANTLIITNEEGVIEWVNPAFTTLTGYSAEEVVGQTPRLLKSDRHDEVFYSNLWNTIKSGGVWHGEIVNRRKDGSLYVEDMTITPVPGETGEISKFIAVKQDITERKRVEKIKNEFISIVSHELRTPLTSIRGSLGLMAGGVAGDLPPQARRLTEIAMRNSERLIRLVNDILDVEKINAGKMVFAVQPYDTAVLVEHALEVNRAYGEQHGVEFVLENGLSSAARICVDSDRFEQVMANLLSNAAKFSPAGSKIRVSLSRHDGSVRIAVSDKGPGIPEEFQNKIFEAFVQADSSDSRSKGGTGLGLTITRTIVERLGGEIGFITAPGEGTTFFVNLPEWQETTSEAAPGMEPGRPRILVCEDDRDIAALINTMLQKGGFEIDIAYNADQAKRLMMQQHYAALVLDLLLPYQDGLSLIRELREDESLKDLPIVVVSAKAQEGREELGGSVLGVMDWIGKPIDFGRLVDSVKLATRHKGGQKPRILHVEDDPGIIQLTTSILQDTARVAVAPSIRDARVRLERETFDLVILDLVLPDGSGLELLPLLRVGGEQEVPVVIFTGYEIDEKTMKDAAAVLYKGRTSARQLIQAVASLMKHENVNAEGEYSI